jgi:hypothetical protein
MLVTRPWGKVGMDISRELFDQQRRPRFGNANPERMQLAFWDWMIRGADPPSTSQPGILEDVGLMLREGILKSVHGPWRARDHFHIPLNRAEGPIWTFDRMGRTCTKLADGRMLCVGGEHEDCYDPDFYIYNDVVAFHADGEFEVYGYPREVFPPTDFHTATPVTNRLILIGCLGYPDDRAPGVTPTYALDTATYRIEKIAASGEMPGWIFEHDAEFKHDQQVIVVKGGQQVVENRSGQQLIRRNVDDYELDVRTWAWRRVTHRNWRQFSIRQEDEGFFNFAQTFEIEALLPSAVEHSTLPCDEPGCRRIDVRGVPVSLTEDTHEIRVIVEGDLPEDLVLKLVDDVRSNAEAALHRRCVLDEM